MAGQPRPEGRKRMPRFQHRHDRGGILERMLGADLRREAPADLLVVGGCVQRLLDPRHGAVLKARGKLLGALDFTALERRRHLFGDGLGLPRHQVASDPVPDRIERLAGDAAGMLVGRGIVDQEWLKRLEEQPRQIARPFGARHVARIAPQFLQHEFGTRHIVAAQQTAFDLGHQQSACVRMQILEILPQPLDEEPVGHTLHSTLSHPESVDSATALISG